MNPWPGIEQHRVADFFRWIRERRAAPILTRRKIKGPAVAEPSFEVPRAEPARLTATWVGHTSVFLQLDGLNLLTDPIWSERASPLSFAGPKRYSPPGVDFDSIPIVDAVLVSHDHYDHLDAPTVRRIISRFPAAAWKVPLETAAFFRRRGARDVEELTWHQATELGEIRVTCVPAQHFSGRGPLSRNRTLWCGWVLEAEKHSVYFAGDTALNPSFSDIGKRYGPFDLALMPIGAYDPRWFMRSVHMDPEECVKASAMMSPNVSNLPLVLATHWGTFKLTDEPLDEPPLRMRAAWAKAGFPPEKLWIPRLGETRSL